ncbi:MAG: Uncharacterised protein [Flavobacteriales bacterium UBA4585]|nr:MAG: Uncharacterised protein [Flavobacteriales bacterium UBA4585]
MRYGSIETTVCTVVLQKVCKHIYCREVIDGDYLNFITLDKVAKS